MFSVLLDKYLGMGLLDPSSTVIKQFKYSLTMYASPYCYIFCQFLKLLVFFIWAIFMDLICYLIENFIFTSLMTIHIFSLGSSYSSPCPLLPFFKNIVSLLLIFFLIPHITPSPSVTCLFMLLSKIWWKKF